MAKPSVGATSAQQIDIAYATGRGLLITAEHDGRIVADVVDEWAGAR